jgi:hypothetical protein
MRAATLAVLTLVACRPPGYGEGDDDDATDAGGDAAAAAPDGAAIDAGPDAPALTCEASFALAGRADATSVWLTGDFVAWAGTPEAGAVPLALDGEVWRGGRVFDEGSYQYKFVVDGAEWIPDPDNPETVDDGFGGVNSVYRCER